MRVGFGNDIHRLEEGRELYLGGVHIPYSKGSVAHSDGDVLLHALIDAILGSLALGDIGTHFPPSDESYRGIASSELLKKTLEIAKPDIINIDAVVTLEKCRLKDHIVKIRESIASLCQIDISRVSVKAKTNEGLDALGRDEAIKAEVIILIAD